MVQSWPAPARSADRPVTRLGPAGCDRAQWYVRRHGRAKTRDALAGSLDRLGLDYLDLYLIHWPLPRLGLFTESYETMLELVSEGLIRSVGVSNFIVAIPKSSSAERQRANLDVFGFALTEAELAALAALDQGEGEAVDSDVHEEF